jgi:hypothetical protein
MELCCNAVETGEQSVSYSLHLECAATSSYSQQLVTQTNTEDGFMVFMQHDLPNVINCNITHSRITRPIAEEKPIELLWVQGVVPLNYIQPCSSPQETPHLVVLQTAVNNTYSGASFGIVHYRSLQNYKSIQSHT